MNQEEKISLLEDFFEVEPGTITQETLLKDLDWDSMNMLGLIALFKENFNKKLTPAQLSAYKTIGDVAADMEGD